MLRKLREVLPRSRANRMPFMKWNKEWLKQAKDDVHKKGEQAKRQYEEWNNKWDFNKYLKDKRLLVGAGLLCYGSYRLKEYLSIDESISHQELYRYLEKDKVSALDIESSTFVHGQKQIRGRVLLEDNSIRYLTVGNVDHLLLRMEEIQKEKGRNTSDYLPVRFVGGLTKDRIGHHLHQIFHHAVQGLTLLLIIKQFKGALGNFSKGKDMFGMNNKKSQFQQDTKVNVTFKNVAGQDTAKQEITEFVEFLKDSEKFSRIGARLPRGALLCGPPGTGKTLLAKAVAGEAGVPFFSVSGSEFVEMFVGLGASRVRELFAQAKQKSPSIIFIDEIDAVGKKREGFGGNDERDSTLNQLLVEMDGFGTDSTVVILAATNRADTLDAALLRPGRFDRQVDVQLPDLAGRKDIFKIYLQQLTLSVKADAEVFARRLATLSPGFSGADIANLCNEAAILAARKQKDTVDAFDFEMASERILAGMEKKGLVNKEERKVVAVHESGHAVTSWFLPGTMPLLKLTIIPRTKGSLGFAQYLPSESTLLTKEQLQNQITYILGGRCAEEEFFGRVTTGAYDDLQKAYGMAHEMVTRYGMTTRLNNLSLPQENGFIKHYSDHYQRIIDQEINALIDEAAQLSKELVHKHKKQIIDLSEALLEKETLDLNDIQSILGERPFPTSDNFREYLQVRQEVEQERQQDQMEKEKEQHQVQSTS